MPHESASWARCSRAGPDRSCRVAGPGGGRLSYYASSHPDGLEYVAAENGFADKAQTSATAGSPLADYAVSGVSDERISVGVAGILGVAVTALLGFGCSGW
ncbi:MAG: PDGLE domain-containing protein [Candidatus Nanopelagicales bacterium]